MKVSSIVALAIYTFTACLPAQTDPAQEPSVQAVAKAMPAVVNINTERTVKHTVRNPYDDFYNEFFGGAMRPPRTIKQKVQSLGSGFLIDASGYIITNEHVVDRAAEMKISVTLPDGKDYTAKYITGDPERDLALIKIERPEPFPFISLEDLSPNYLGQTCLVLGNPLGYGSSVSRGILSAVGRSVTVANTEYANLLQTDAAINPGNSGGPLVDLGGRLIGVSSVKMSYTPQGVPTQGIAFAIPAQAVREKVEEFRKIERGEKLPEKPSLARKYFGLQLQDLDAKLAASFGYPDAEGIVITEIEANSPAAEAELIPGLILSSIGRYTVSTVRDVEKLMGKIDQGSRVDFGISYIRKAGNRYVRRAETVEMTAR